MEFPPNVKVTRIPKNINFEQGGTHYQSSYSQNGNQVDIKRVLKVQRPGAVCQAEELEVFKAYFPIFLSDMRGQIFYE